MTESVGMGTRNEDRPKRGVPPALVLFCLAPMTAELLTGSAPPSEFFNPFSLLVLTALYGSGAILVRELVLRWQKGWPSILVLGAAYGIVEEGLMVKSFFDPHWVDLGTLGVYGRWAGVNWVWSLGLTLFHAVWSICLPILLVTLMFPRRAAEPWVGRRLFRFFGGLMVVDVVFGFFALTPYRPPALPYLLAVLAVIGLCVVARRLPVAFKAARRAEPGSDRPRSLRYFAAGLVGAIAFFALLWGIPNTGVSPAMNLALLLLLTGGVVVGLRGGGAPSRWQARRQLALAGGALSFFIVLAPLQQLDPARAVETRGMALVGLAMALFLVWLAGRTRRFEREGMLLVAPP
jgi:hypothetical protein